MAYRIAKALDKLRDQIDALSPKRNKASDGWIGDARHQASKSSDHNPHVKDGKVGVVTALDITHDPTKGVDVNKIAAALQRLQDPRIKYVIWAKRIMSGTEQNKPAWTWRPYSGKNPHTKHIHISVKPEKAKYDETKPWDLGIAEAAKVAASLPPAKDKLPAKAILKRGSKGGDVFELQRLLGVTVDGDFGPKTEKAVKAFQAQNSLVADAIVGPYTWEALEASGHPGANLGVSGGVPDLPPSNPEIAMEFFQSKGWEKHQAAAIVGHAQQESYKDLRPAAVGDAGESFGIFQWNGPRQVGLKAFALQSGRDYRDFHTQLAFVEYELATTERRTDALLKNAKTVEEAVKAFMGYERPSGFTWAHPERGHGYTNRLRNAEALMK